MKHVVSFSGGKDSTAMLLLLLEQNKPIDEVVFFDTGTWEFPEMNAHVDKVEKYTGCKITRLHPRKSFDYWFKDHIIGKGKRVGVKGYGFPSMSRRWCTREKVATINRCLEKGDIVYIGFAIEERKRIKKNNIKTIKEYPLIENYISEEDALKICYKHGFDWGGLYKHFNRVSCWCCPLQKKSELRKLYLYYPELWERLEKMQKESWNSFRMDYKRVENFSEEFYWETQQGKLF